MRTIRESAHTRLFLTLSLVNVALHAACSDENSDGPGGMATGLAVISSDQNASVSVSLVDPTTGLVVRDHCVHAGTMAPQLSAALSADLALPSQPQAGNELLLIDRKNATLTWVAPATCQVLRQMRAGDFASNPQDVVDLGNGKAYVTRYNMNPAMPTEGSDILVIEPKAARVVGGIDLRPHAAQGDVPADKPILPMPSRALWVDGKVYVVLNDLSADFKDAGGGRVVIVDPQTDKVAGTIDLPGLKNCGALDHLPASKVLVVGCGGPYSDGPKRVDTSGFAWIDLAMTPPAVKVVPATAFGRPVSGLGRLGVVSDGLAFTMTEGDFKGPGKDTLWSFDFNGGAPKKVFEASGAFVLDVFLDRTGKKLYALEASDASPKVHVYATDGAAGPEKKGEFVSNATAGLPPRSMGWY